MSKIYIIHENSEWTVHLTQRLDELGLPYEEWFLDKGTVDLSAMPPAGVFYSRMSASSHTRSHRFAPELTEAVLAWLERHGRRVFNGSRALRLEISKVNQYMALNAHGIRTPKTIAAVGKEQIVEAAKQLGAPSFITKHNRAGKGLGVQLFHSIEALQQYLESPAFEDSVDGITLVQEYIQAPEPFITRCEFVGGKFMYAVRVDTSEGFELCPADACQIGDLFCPVGETAARPKFEIIDGFSDPILEKYEQFLRANDIHIAGIEFIRDQNGTIFTYDVNTNTNYNSEAEARAGKFGMLEVAKFLGEELKRLQAVFV
ncbi:ATP-grasp domain-containing protein [Parageobacillus thermoglucosidasius]|uniref:Alpha-L-glutamate ligase n=1 Tax=Parageobacillus thermoglucosidasius TaxID=1426 RepID=A0AAN0YND1_PARTM|nr:alpha-L-glutamate ligase [Parageobacillus thermoglucosidasius]ALF10256.1 alpha-L-glutamate ligase [Parageobacillus thermoglucosidasius]ANZ30338.1 alpha-L-glutamate ligase [Parageobacillus thermoglucosidasius]APM81076.1 alpha-L-glutamate ligase [Parageobacillus thermoglucosidasius]KJX70790.1 alpha-L-glutamate ligase [Parageobacillus thermoglucosidasius]RDE21667.1 alpha-L-glutamate ligase [Parageobacillus thermoglucosidasius]